MGLSNGELKTGFRNVSAKIKGLPKFLKTNGGIGLVASAFLILLNLVDSALSQVSLLHKILVWLTPNPWGFAVLFCFFTIFIYFGFEELERKEEENSHEIADKIGEVASKIDAKLAASLRGETAMRNYYDVVAFTRDFEISCKNFDAQYEKIFEGDKTDLERVQAATKFSEIVRHFESRWNDNSFTVAEDVRLSFDRPSKEKIRDSKLPDGFGGDYNAQQEFHIKEACLMKESFDSGINMYRKVLKSIEQRNRSVFNPQRR